MVAKKRSVMVMIEETEATEQELKESNDVRDAGSVVRIKPAKTVGIATEPFGLI